MTLEELYAYITAQLIAPVNTVQKIKNCFNAVIEYFSTNGNANFTIDQQGTDRSLYDAEDAGFTFYNTATGMVSFKNSATVADWSAEFQWKGDKGDKGDPGDEGGPGPPGLTTVFTDGETIVGNGTELFPLTVLPTPSSTGTDFLGDVFVDYLGGLQIQVIWPTYSISGIIWPSGTNTVTLGVADDTYDRFDALILTASGLSVLQGEPELNPQQPFVNPVSELLVVYVLVHKDQVELSDDAVVYDEGTETTVASNNGTLNILSTSAPLTGLYNLSMGSFGATHYIDFTFLSPLLRTDFEQIRFYHWLRSQWSNNTYIRLTFFNGATVVSSTVNITSGAFNFLRTSALTWQQIIIPLLNFTFSGNQFNRIRITFNGSNVDGFKIDNFLIQKGLAAASTMPNSLTSIITDIGVANVTQPADTFRMIGAGGLIVSAVGKDITFTQGGTLWEVITANVAAAVGGKSYLCNSASKLEIALNTNYLNKSVRVSGSSTGGWKITFLTPVVVEFLGETITASLESTSEYDSIELLNVATNKWRVISSIGNILFT